MKSGVPNVFRTGDTLDPNRMNRNFQAMAADLADSVAQRFTISAFTLDFGSATEADDAEELTRYIKPPATWGAFDIVGAELHLPDVTTETEPYVLSVTGDTGGWEDVSLVESSTTQRTADNFVASCAANTELSFVFSCAAATWTATNAHAVIWIRHDRHQGSPPAPSIFDITSATNDAATTPNTNITNITAASSTNTGATERLRIEVVRGMRNAGATPAGNVWHIPSRGETLKQWDLCLAADTTADVTAVLTDEGAATVSTLTNTSPSGPTVTDKDQGNVLDEVQGTDDPDDSTDDYKITWTYAGTGTVKIAYAVLYWEA